MYSVLAHPLMFEPILKQCDLFDKKRLFELLKMIRLEKICSLEGSFLDKMDMSC